MLAVDFTGTSNMTLDRQKIGDKMQKTIEIGSSQNIEYKYADFCILVYSSVNRGARGQWYIVPYVFCIRSFLEIPRWLIIIELFVLKERCGGEWSKNITAVSIMLK